jgi:hypothetical protein
MLAHAFGGSTLVSGSRVGLVGIVVSLSVSALLALDCGSKNSETASSAASTAPKLPEEASKPTLPADFPTDVPIYPGATVLNATEIPGKNLKAGWTTADEPNKVASYYTEAFTAQGWSAQRMERDGGILVFADKRSRSAAIGIGTSKGKTTIDLLAVEQH